MFNKCLRNLRIVYLFRIKFKYFSFANMYPIREVRCEEDLQFRHPFNGLIAGPSQCGKTTLLRQILESHEQTIAGINREIIKVAWCYGKWQPSYEIPLTGVDLKYINGMPEEEDIFGFDIIILDDLIHEIEKSLCFPSLYSRYSPRQPECDDTHTKLLSERRNLQYIAKEHTLCNFIQGSWRYDYCAHDGMAHVPR
jgi:hypothetical protein